MRLPERSGRSPCPQTGISSSFIWNICTSGKTKNKKEGKVKRMTPRENLLHLLRREGYETVPVEFMLCPSLEKSFQEEIGGPGADYMEYFGMPWRRVGELIPEDTDVTRFYPYYDEIKDNM